MASVRNGARIPDAYSSSDSEEYGADPLLCHVSRTNFSRSIWAPHFLHFITTLSIHGLWSSKFSPSGRFDAAETISFLENNLSMWPHSLQFHIGNGQPQNLSREIHHGCFSFIIPRNRFFG